jgi:hypothetical protein
VPPEGFEPSHLAPEASALSPELWGLTRRSVAANLPWMRLPVPARALDALGRHRRAAAQANAAQASAALLNAAQANAAQANAAPSGMSHIYGARSAPLRLSRYALLRGTRYRGARDARSGPGAGGR